MSDQQPDQIADLEWGEAVVEAPSYRAVHWGSGPGLLVCEACGAVVFPDPDADFDLHADWHADMNDALAEMYEHLRQSETTDG